MESHHTVFTVKKQQTSCITYMCELLSKYYKKPQIKKKKKSPFSILLTIHALMWNYFLVKINIYLCLSFIQPIVVEKNYSNYLLEYL